MNARERIENRIQGRPSDRPPNMNIVMQFAARENGYPYGRVVRDGRLLAEGMLRCCERFGIDCLWTISDSMREAGDVGAAVVVPEEGVPYCPVPLVKRGAYGSAVCSYPGSRISHLHFFPLKPKVPGRS